MKTRSDRYNEKLAKLTKQKEELLDSERDIAKILGMLINRQENGNMLYGEEKYIGEESNRLKACKKRIEKCNNKIEAIKKRLTVITSRKAR